MIVLKRCRNVRLNPLFLLHYRHSLQDHFLYLMLICMRILIPFLQNIPENAYEFSDVDGLCYVTVHACFVRFFAVFLKGVCCHCYDGNSGFCMVL